MYNFVAANSVRQSVWLKNQTEQMDNYFVAFIKLYLTYIFFCYLRASDERPTMLQLFCCIQKICIKENGVHYALRFLMPTK